MRTTISTAAPVRLALFYLCCAAGCARPPDGDGGTPDADADSDGDSDADSDSDVDISGGCDGSAGEAAQPFANHGASYAAGALLPAVDSQSERDAATAAYYDEWKARYLRGGCGEGRYYIDTGMAQSLTVSEAIGYGMLIEAFMAGYDPGARAQFDGLLLYYRDHPSQGVEDLMAWSQDSSCANNEGAMSASDGDLDAAYALLLADKQWGSSGAVDYFGEAALIIEAIMGWEVDAGGAWVLLGDWVEPGDYYDATRSSDFMPGHFAAFESAVGNGFFASLADAEYGMMGELQDWYAPSTGLVPDFISNPGADPEPAAASFLESANDGDYSYNACRVPLRVGVHYLTSGDARAQLLLGRIDAWIEVAAGGNVAGIASGYSLDGDVLSGADYPSMAFTAPLAVAAMADPGAQNWLDALWEETAYGELEDDYFGDTLRMLALIALSGNWWSPDAAPCP